MLDELTDVEKARLLIWKARHPALEDMTAPIVVKPPTSPVAAPSKPVSVLRQTKSQRRFRRWVMALVVACALSCCGVMGYAVWVVVR